MVLSRAMLLIVRPHDYPHRSLGNVDHFPYGVGRLSWSFSRVFAPTAVLPGSSSAPATPTAPTTNLDAYPRIFREPSALPRPVLAFINPDYVDRLLHGLGRPTAAFPYLLHEPSALPTPSAYSLHHELGCPTAALPGVLRRPWLRQPVRPQTWTLHRRPSWPHSRDFSAGALSDLRATSALSMTAADLLHG